MKHQQTTFFRTPDELSDGTSDNPGPTGPRTELTLHHAAI
jgi:hypothetical protein